MIEPFRVLQGGWRRVGGFLNVLCIHMFLQKVASREVCAIATRPFATEGFIGRLMPCIAMPIQVCPSSEALVASLAMMWAGVSVVVATTLS